MQVLVAAGDKTLAIRYQNENIVAWMLGPNGVPLQSLPVIVAPDALCYLQNSNGQPMSNVELLAAFQQGLQPDITLVKVKR